MSTATTQTTRTTLVPHEPTEAGIVPTAAGTSVGQLMHLQPQALAERVQSLADRQLTGLLRLAQTGLERSLGKATGFAEAERSAHCTHTLRQADRYARVCQALVRELIMRS